MNALTRGVRNAFRNPLRTLAVTAILGLSLGLVVVMLAARSAVSTRITEVKESIGNTVTVSPAGGRGFLGGGEPLAQTKVDALAAITNVTSVDATIDAQLRPTDDTSLQNPIEAGTLGGRQRRVFIQGRSGQSTSINDEQAAPADFKPPIFAIGTSNPSYAGEMVGANVKITDGALFATGSDEDVAVIGKSLAEKNSLKVGSTFTAYTKKITVVGIFDIGNEFANSAIVFPLKTLQRLSEQTTGVTAAIVHVNSVDNLATVTSSVKSTFGDAADVTSSEESVQDAIEPLENIHTIATTSLFGALIAAAIISLLTMVMVVRERRKEIAVLKAIGASEPTIVTQFVAESVILSLIGSVIGTVLGFLLSNPILRALLNSSSNASGPSVSGDRFGGPAGGGIRVAIGGFRAVRGAIQNLQAVVDWHLILYGIIAAIVVAIVGAAFPAWLISRVRPAEVLRSE